MRIPEIILAELNGHDYTLEDGTRHIKLKVYNRLAGVLPKGSGRKQEADRRVNLNIRSQIRKIIREHAPVMKPFALILALMLCGCGESKQVVGICNTRDRTFLYRVEDGSLMASFKEECTGFSFRTIAPSAVPEICPDFKGELK